MTAKATGEYSIRYQYLGGQLRKLNEAGGGLNLEASKTSKTYRLSAKYSLGYTHSMEAGLPMLSRMEQRLTFSGKAWFAQKFFVMGDYHWDGIHFLYPGSDSFHRHDLGIAAGFGLKKNKYIISLSAHNLLSQHDRYTITTDATGITQEWAPLSGRYFMLNFACRLRSMNPPRYFGGLKSGEE